MSKNLRMYSLSKPNVIFIGEIRLLGFLFFLNSFVLVIIGNNITNIRLFISRFVKKQEKNVAVPFIFYLFTNFDFGRIL